MFRFSMKKYHRIGGLRGLASAFRGEITRQPVLLPIRWPGVKHPLTLRFPSSDIAVFHQIFIKKEYEFDVTRTPATIVDAGANIGLASIYFANKFPDAKIIAVEPEASNLEILKTNIAPYGNIFAVNGALWHENAKTALIDSGVGKWGFITQARDDDRVVAGGKVVCEVQGLTMDAIMKTCGIERIDVLKIDIEGAEREVFKDPSAWIGKVDALIIELHEHLKPGCNRSFYCGTIGFDREWMQLGSVYAERSVGCMVPRCA